MILLILCSLSLLYSNFISFVLFSLSSNTIILKSSGIENFTFELLETCLSNELDEKEKLYIELYDSYNFGYNLTKGNSKKEK